MPSNLLKSIRPKQVHEFVFTRLEQRRVKVLLYRATYLLFLQEIVKTDNIFADFERIEHTELRLPSPSVKSLGTGRELNGATAEFVEKCAFVADNSRSDTPSGGKVVIFLFKILKPLFMIAALRFVHLPLHALLHGENLIPFGKVDIYATAATH